MSEEEIAEAERMGIVTHSTLLISRMAVWDLPYSTVDTFSNISFKNMIFSRAFDFTLKLIINRNHLVSGKRTETITKVTFSSSPDFFISG